MSVQPVNIHTYRVVIRMWDFVQLAATPISHHEVFDHMCIAMFSLVIGWERENFGVLEHVVSLSYISYSLCKYKNY